MSLSGTLIGGVMYAGDDAVAWLDAGYTVRKVDVRCSARIAAGTDTLPPDTTYVACAIDCNGDAARARRVLRGVATRHIDTRYGVGYHNGERHGEVLVTIMPADRLVDVHDALVAGLPGFECFALLLGVSSIR